MISVRTIVVVVDVVLVLVGGAGAGVGAPVVSMCPARAETASVRLRIVATQIRRKGFIFVAPRELQKVCRRKPNKDDRSDKALQGSDGLR